MRLLGLFNIAALVSSLMVLSIACVLVPDKAWTNEAIAALLIFALAVFFIFYTPSVLIKNQSDNDAVQMASIGSLGAITGGNLLLTATAFVLALFGISRLAVVLDIFAIGTFIINCLMLRAASNVIGNVANKYSAPSNHIRWQSDIQGLSGMAIDSGTKLSLEKLAEKFRYAASDVPGGTPSDEKIDIAVNFIGENLSSLGYLDMTSQIERIDILIAQREIFLRAKRNKA
jgi:hypothetical protein